MTQQVPSMRLELIKAILRRYVPAAIVESVIKRAIVTNRLDVQELSHESLEMLVASAVAGLRRVVDAKILSTVMIELTESLDEVRDEFELDPGSVRGYSGAIRIARHGK